MGFEAPSRRERGWRRFVVAAMVNPFTLPALGGSVLVAVALGIHLGQSSIGLINPIYFQGPAVHPRDRGAAIAETRVRPRVVAATQLYGWADGVAARAEDCRNCAAIEARDAHAAPEIHGYSAEVPYFGSREERQRVDLQDEAELRALEAVAERVQAEEAAAAKVTPAVRYAYYPVEQPVEAEEVLPVEADKEYYSQ
jgi:hypothetical protein